MDAVVLVGDVHGLGLLKGVGLRDFRFVRTDAVVLVGDVHGLGLLKGISLRYRILPVTPDREIVVAHRSSGAFIPRSFGVPNVEGTNPRARRRIPPLPQQRAGEPDR